MSTKKAVDTERRPVRERLLAAADELFYEGGIHTVGIDRVIERAGVAKASLYDCFGSKEELIRSYLQARHEARQARISTKLERYATPRERLLGLFDVLGEYFAEPTFRGCAFTRAGAESRAGSPVKDVCDGARGWMHELFTRLAAEAGAPDAEGLAWQLGLLYDGAAVSALLDQRPAAAATARAAAALLLDASLATATATATATAPRRAAAVAPRKRPGANPRP